MSSITSIPKVGQQPDDPDPFWSQTDACAGPVVSDDCIWRYEEMSLVTFTPLICSQRYHQGCEQLVAYARINRAYGSRQKAIFQFCTTLFTCVILAMAFIVFSNDTEQIVIKPIQKIVEIIQTLAENPLKKPVHPVQREETGHQMKTQMLELTIFKIGTLLQRGFGELGAGIISTALIQVDPGLDFYTQGKRVELVFSFCRIRQFTETTECLQDEIIVFVNKIVKIIHECTKKWDGKPTKNYGDKYLLTWRIPSYSDAVDMVKAEAMDQVENQDAANKLKAAKLPVKPLNLAGNQTMSQGQLNEATQLLASDGQLGKASSSNLQQDGKAPGEAMREDQSDLVSLFQTMTQAEMAEYRELVADKALICAVKTIQEINRAQDLQAYSRHPKISHKFGEKYCIKMSFSLHTGKACEGPIGSEFKVDAIYISKEIQIGARIDQLCDLYNREILLSNDLYMMLSERAKEQTRKIETITMNESPKTPIDVYCCDIYPSDAIQSEVEGTEVEMGGFIKHIDFENQPTSTLITKGLEHVLMYDHDFACTARHYKPEFLECFQKARESFYEGDWINANTGLTMAIQYSPQDGPAKWMMQYIEKHKMQPPDEWKGVRDIDAKQEPPPIDYDKNDEQDLEDSEEDQDIAASRKS